MTVIVECEDEPTANSSVIKFLDYQDNENPYDLSLYEAPGDPRPWAGRVSPRTGILGARRPRSTTARAGFWSA